MCKICKDTSIIDNEKVNKEVFYTQKIFKLNLVKMKSSH